MHGLAKKEEVGIVDYVPFDADDRLEHWQQEKAKALNSYGWVDKKKGLIHIPIDEAMKDVIRQAGGNRVRRGEALATSASRLSLAALAMGLLLSAPAAAYNPRARWWTPPRAPTVSATRTSTSSRTWASASPAACRSSTATAPGSRWTACSAGASRCW